MASFIKTRAECLVSLRCPHCNAGYDIEWDTEYGDPLSGEEETECDECGETFVFQHVSRYDVWKRVK